MKSKAQRIPTCGDEEDKYMDTIYCAKGISPGETRDTSVVHNTYDPNKTLVLSIAPRTPKHHAAHYDPEEPQRNPALHHEYLADKIAASQPLP